MHSVAGISFAAAICYFGEKVLGRNKPDICALTCVREKLATGPVSKPSSLHTKTQQQVIVSRAAAGVSFAAAICYFGEIVVGRNKPDVSFEIQQTKLEVQALKQQVDRLVVMFDAAATTLASPPASPSFTATTPASPAAAPPFAATAAPPS
ncbi:hypothetical protein ACET3Z_027456 [Daucus carota]